MNCSTCGAQNAENAQFCAECGTPLEDENIDAPVAGEVPDNDLTLISTSLSDLSLFQPETPSEPAPLPQYNEEHTPPASRPISPVAGPSSPSVEIEAPAEADQEPQPSTPTTNATPANKASKSGGRRTLMIVVGIIVVLLLLCCCCSLLIGALIGSDPDTFEDILRDLSQLPAYLPLG